MTTRSLWLDTPLPGFPTLTADRRCDVAILGGGITGLTAAYLLQRAGKSVVVLERDKLAAADTGHTTAHLAYVTDLRLSKLVDTFGEEAARLVWQAGQAAINAIEAIADKERIECQLRRVPGFLHASLTEKSDETHALRDETDLARELGFAASFRETVPHFQKPGIVFPNQAKFHPRAYLAGLARAIEQGGGAIFEQSEATEAAGDPIVVKANGHSVRCEHLVIATHVPLMGKTALVPATLFQTKLAPYSSYAVGAVVPKGTLPEACFWDTSDPYYYLRVDSRAESDYAIFGGEDHKTGQVADTDQCFVKLEAMLKQILPSARPDRRWSGQVVETNDGLPYIGETAQRQYVATGFSGNGMTFGTASAMMICDAITGKENPWQELFSVDRKKVRGGVWQYLKENFDYPYYLIADRLSSSEGTATIDVPRGEGKILTLDGQRVACSRDDQGQVTTVSAVCPHMGCLVHWNGAERTWDCPCHGSRFHPSGEVLAGPAESPLEAISRQQTAAAS
ncbi:MAG: FAD-dependent oxidoreductase [Pirellulaceae bacterium]